MTYEELSRQLSSSGRFPQGPDWHIALAIVELCDPSQLCRIEQLQCQIDDSGPESGAKPDPVDLSPSPSSLPPVDESSDDPPKEAAQQSPMGTVDNCIEPNLDYQYRHVDPHPFWKSGIGATLRKHSETVRMALEIYYDDMPIFWKLVSSAWLVVVSAFYLGLIGAAIGVPIWLLGTSNPLGHSAPTSKPTSTAATAKPTFVLTTDHPVKLAEGLAVDAESTQIAEVLNTFFYAINTYDVQKLRSVSSAKLQRQISQTPDTHATSANGRSNDISILAVDKTSPGQYFVRIAMHLVDGTCITFVISMVSGNTPDVPFLVDNPMSAVSNPSLC